MNKYNCYIPMLLEHLVAWRRIGETTLFRDQLWSIEENKLPLIDESVLATLKNSLPRFENIRNVVLIEIEKPEFYPATATATAISTYLTYDDVKAIYTLDTDMASKDYIQSLLPSTTINRKNILDDRLSKQLIDLSKEKDAKLGAEKILSIFNKKNNTEFTVDDNHSLLKNIFEAIHSCKSEQKPGDKISLFFYELFSFSRKSMKNRNHPDGLAFIHDMAEILKNAMGETTLGSLNLCYSETLANLKKKSKDHLLIELIKEIREESQIIQRLSEYYGTNYFTPALIFLKLKRLHNTIDAKQFNDLIDELNKINCDKESISNGIVLYGSYFGYTEIHQLYYDLKEYIPSTSNLEVVDVENKNSNPTRPVEEKKNDAPKKATKQKGEKSNQPSLL
ncbi:MAG: hypothetical protein ACH34X_04475 [Thiolinea sp.]